MRVADYISHYLEEIGVRAVFLVSGGGMMHLLDAVSRMKTLKYYCNHHEQCCGFAAEAYARQSRSLGVAYGTSGPGGTNLITAITTAWQDSTPVLFITGQSKLSQTISHSGLAGLRQFGGFEVDIVPIVKSITKFAVVLNNPSDIKYVLEKAHYLALSGRPGPVLIDIPVDIQGAPVNPSELLGFDLQSDSTLKTDQKDLTGDINLIIDKLLHSQRPLILSGHGVSCSGAECIDEFNALIQKLNIPIVTTQLGKDVIEYNNNLYIGNIGVKGDRPGNFAIQNADFVLCLGCSLHVFNTGYELNAFAPDAFKVQVEIDPWVLKRERVGVQLKVQSSLQHFIRTFSSALTSTFHNEERIKYNAWHSQCINWKNKFQINNENHFHPNDTINIYDICEALSELCNANHTLIADSGSSYYIIGQAFKVKKGQRVIICGALGQMGYALPASTGASVADPTREIICVVGDGSFQTNLHELATIKHNNLNVKIIVINNGGYVSIRNTQIGFFDGHLAGTSKESGVFCPELETIALAYGIPYIKATSRSNLNSQLKSLLSEKGPVICEVYSNYEQKVIPSVSSSKLPNGSMVSNSLDKMSPFIQREDY